MVVVFSGSVVVCAKCGIRGGIVAVIWFGGCVDLGVGSARGRAWTGSSTMAIGFEGASSDKHLVVGAVGNLVLLVAFIKPVGKRGGDSVVFLGINAIGVGSVCDSLVATTNHGGGFGRLHD